MSFRTPKYRLHKGSGQALVQINGERTYLGKYGTEESKGLYRKLVAEWLASGQKPASLASTAPAANRPVTINELILAFWQHVKERYIKNGDPTSELRSFRTALRPVRQLYGGELAANFGPLALVACRQGLIEARICRTRINQHVTRIRQMFKWGVARELVQETVWRALCSVEGLRFGEAVETEPVKPAPEEHIIAIEPFVTPQIWAMVKLQLWSACRPAASPTATTCSSNVRTCPRRRRPRRGTRSWNSAEKGASSLFRPRCTNPATATPGPTGVRRTICRCRSCLLRL